MEPAEILADQGLRNVAIAQPLEEALDRGGRLRIGPVIADTGAVAEMPLRWRFSSMSAVM
jgi:hypothetical protein